MTKPRHLSQLDFEVVLQRLRTFASDLGVDIQIVPDGTWAATVRPFHVDVSPTGMRDFLAVDFEAWKVFVHKSAPRTPTLVGGLLHEIAHVVADNRTPERTMELDFLGWEYAAAKKLQILRHWKVWMHDYGLSNGDDFGDLAPQDQQVELRTAYLDAIERGLVTKKGAPLRVRKAPPPRLQLPDGLAAFERTHNESTVP